jgi:glycerol uptake facilitator-like aquaporin
MAQLLICGGSDAGLAAGPRARGVDPASTVTVLVASICGLPFCMSGEKRPTGANTTSAPRRNSRTQVWTTQVSSPCACASPPAEKRANCVLARLGQHSADGSNGDGKAVLMRKALAEFVGTALLLIAVVGSGIAAQTLSPSDPGLALLENAVATGAALVAIILAVGSVSGAHLNPLVSVADALFGGLRPRELITYAIAQVTGAVMGVIVANLMFSLPAVTVSTHVRVTPGLWLAEVVATFGLLLVVFGVVRSGRTSMAPFAVGAYITGAYFFTSSTSFANPAVTLARTLSDTFAGIAPASVPGFVLAQVVGLVAAYATVRALWPESASCEHLSDSVVVPHESVGRTIASR